MRSETDVLVAELAALGLAPERLPRTVAGAELIRAQLVPGLGCLFRIAEPSEDIFDFSCTVSVTVDMEDRRSDVQRIMMMLDDLIVPCRMHLIGDELALAVHGTWGDAEGLAELGLEAVLMLRRLAVTALAPVLAAAAGEVSTEDAFTRILTGLRSDPFAQTTTDNAADEARNV